MVFLFFKKKILIVEDSEPLYKAIIFELERGGYKVLTAHSYDEAVLQLKKYKNIHSIWLDHSLQGEKTGLDVLDYIRSEDRYKRIPVYVVSAVEEYREEYLRRGIERYFEKSQFQLGTIIRAIRNNIKR